MDNIVLYTKLTNLPEYMKLEVADFIDFLLSKAKKENKYESIPAPIFGSAKGMFKVDDCFA